jgi:hypothetical protein
MEFSFLVLNNLVCDSEYLPNVFTVTNPHTKLDVCPLLKIPVTHFPANSIPLLPLLLGNECSIWSVALVNAS